MYIYPIYTYPFPPAYYSFQFPLPLSPCLFTHESNGQYLQFLLDLVLLLFQLYYFL